MRRRKKMRNGKVQTINLSILFIVFLKKNELVAIVKSHRQFRPLELRGFGIVVSFFNCFIIGHVFSEKKKN